ncbi:MAG: hypothetical protein J6S40_03920 [Thermoguttaceae bacterium]|nr:hypothetical protein [Thermoguttaceae bacterium]
MNIASKAKQILTLLPIALLTLSALGAPAVRTVDSPDGEKSASVQISPDPIQLGESAEMTITVTLPAGCETVPPAFPPSYGAMTVESVKADPPTLTGGKHTSVFHVRLIPDRSGKLFLPPIPIETRDAAGSPSPLLIPAGEVEVVSRYDPESASLSQLSSPAPPIKQFPWILAAALLAGAVTFIVLARGFFRSPFRLAAKELSPREKALRRLDVLKNSGLAESDLHEYYIHLTGIVRVFIEETTGIRAPEQTTEEFLRHIETEPNRSFSPQARVRLARFLESADMVKFAKFRPAPDEVAAGEESARGFVSTFEPPTPTKEGSVS